MKSICIKLSNEKSVQYLLEQFNKFEIKNIYFSCKKFKIYYNVIVHYYEKNISEFLKSLSTTLTFFIIDMYEKNIIDNLIKSEYFYFNISERNKIANITYEDLYNTEEAVYSPSERFDGIYKAIYNYFLNNHSILLKGFVPFRLKNYFEQLLEQIDKSVNKYIIEKEYTEFISLLKIYVKSEVSSCNEVHLIYINSKTLLLDENKNIIKIDENILSRKYLSDISFSSNDYILNTLLNLIPKKIYIHTMNDTTDEFINTIKLIFEDRVSLCNDCSICKIYKKSHAIQS